MEKFELIEDLGKIGEKKDRRGELVEMKLCKVSWFGKAPTFDIRTWDSDGMPGKGVSLSPGMLRNLRSILDEMDDGGEK